MSLSKDSPDGEYVNGWFDQTNSIAELNPERSQLEAMLAKRLKSLDHNDTYHAGGTDAIRDALAGLIFTEEEDT